MLEKFRNHLLSNWPDIMGQKLLLATSGGLDSMVMVFLFEKLGVDVVLLHCNFGLRGEESDSETQFVTSYAQMRALKLNVKRFDTIFEADQNQESIQLAARRLRYAWFYEELNSEKADWIVTAHHADDNLETFFINLTRATGLDGLMGIPQQNGKVIRPLLPFSREEILRFAQLNNLKWKEDSSNASDKYLRNKIRHQLVPILKKIQPNVLDSFLKTQSYLQESQQLLDSCVEKVEKEVVNVSDDSILISIERLKANTNWESILFRILKKYDNFHRKDVEQLCDSQTGKKVISDNYILLKNRDVLILQKKDKEIDKLTYFIEKNEKEVNIPIKMQFSTVDVIEKASNHTIFVDVDKINFPLELRKWKEGDSFCPKGMHGKSKKVSKYFKDKKFSLFEKENTWLLCSNEEIVWIVGHRADHRFEANPNKTKSIYRISINK